MSRAGFLHSRISSELLYKGLHEYTRRDVCEIYSGGRFLHELIGDEMESSDYGPADSELKFLRRVMEELGSPDEVPDGIPESHFWWFIEKKASDDTDWSST